MKRKLIPLVLFALVLACSASYAAEPPQVTMVVMVQQPCQLWGTCPHYIVAMNSDGTGSYVGLEATKRKASVPLNFPVAAFNRVVRELKRIGFAKFQPSYTSTADGCKEMATDESSATFLVVRGGKVQTVDVYWGCKLPGVVDGLSKLASAINKASGVVPLLGTDQ